MPEDDRVEEEACVGVDTKAGDVAVELGAGATMYEDWPLDACGVEGTSGITIESVSQGSPPDGCISGTRCPCERVGTMGSTLNMSAMRHSNEHLATYTFLPR
jgi:hypothetical protein